MSDESVGPVRKIIRATREITVNIKGEEFDCLLVPRNGMAEVDFSQFPEDDPLKRERNIGLMTGIHLERDVDLEYAPKGDGAYRLTKHGARRLLDSL